MPDQRLPSTSDEFLTVAEVAQTLRLNQQTIRNWIDQGTLPAVRIGRRVRITRADLERVIEQGYSGSPAGRGDEANQARAFWDGEEHTAPDLAE
jgi:excisionase family DNA binding protein